ncbi:hypothetical protein ARMGADRAFT_1101341 [Armillaria gallica]|uniref:ATP-dependent RNA helicase n=1 Tax=Armillaria gallica TaxID=47427 RepID=A0A2H3DW60_ARMGA|nr:hypothetical protein ARMGADRAFT_1101341 [Armillaria gallica]
MEWDSMVATKEWTTGKPFSSPKNDLLHETLKAITIKPFELISMTVVQEKVLSFLPGLTRPYNPKSTSTYDLLTACIGMGKTLPHLARQAAKNWGWANIRAVIISPTWQLATQIINETLTLSYHHERFKVWLLVGEMSKHVWLHDWTKGKPDIIVATPGHIGDIINFEPNIAKALKTTCIMVLELDDDMLLDIGFHGVNSRDLPLTPKHCLTSFFTAGVQQNKHQVVSSVAVHQIDQDIRVPVTAQLYVQSMASTA